MGGRRYQYFYYHCSGYNSHGLKGCEEARFASATKLEGQVWKFVRGILLDPAELRSDLDRAIELEKEGRCGDPEAEAKHWLEKPMRSGVGSYDSRPRAASRTRS